MKRCTKCAEVKELEQFSQTRNGVRPSCKECRRQEAKAYRLKNKEAVTEYSRQYYANNKEAHKERCVSWQKRNTDAVKAIRKRYVKNNYEKVLDRNKQRQTFKKLATPPWTDKLKMRNLYKFAAFLSKHCGTPVHVDHDIPLMNPNVCGLHVYENLKLTKAGDNMKKSNSFGGVL